MLRPTILQLRSGAISTLALDPPVSRTPPPPPAGDAGEAPTLAQLVYDQLESRILAGQWLPDTKVSLRTLAGSLNTSMQPGRGAVGRLLDA